ncbi:MAG: MmcQ/YjbR family DNA-binding protein [Anaerolineae bacterium]|nr:MmcQ/YjbR family DNA-binding protein [Anaerolineae bacterium]
MNRNDLCDKCLSLSGAVEEFPFGPDAAVYKVRGKMFALIPVAADPPTISLKSDPVEAEMLREMYIAVQPGYHLNKKHWNTVTVDGEIPEAQIIEMIDDSYTLVRQKLSKKEQKVLQALEQDESTANEG